MGQKASVKSDKHANKTQVLTSHKDAAHEQTLPTFIYSYTLLSFQLHRTHLVTGQQSCCVVYAVNSFKPGCGWCELPGGFIFITGGGDRILQEASKIDTLREFAVSSQRRMLYARRSHAAVHHSQHVYVLGGTNGYEALSKCERYVCAEQQWEVLPALPVACYHSSDVVIENSLYVVGGITDNREVLDTVQKLSLDTLTWQVMQLRLPRAGYGIPCFKYRDTEVYLVLDKTLYSFTPLLITELKTLSEALTSDFGTSHYFRGYLYRPNRRGVERLAIELRHS
jgi:hypothetical protein